MGYKQREKKRTARALGAPNSKAIAIECPACGAAAGQPCLEDGFVRRTHPSRRALYKEQELGHGG